MHVSRLNRVRFVYAMLQFGINRPVVPKNLPFCSSRYESFVTVLYLRLHGLVGVAKLSEDHSEFDPD